MTPKLWTWPVLCEARGRSEHDLIDALREILPTTVGPGLSVLLGPDDDCTRIVVRDDVEGFYLSTTHHTSRHPEDWRIAPGPDGVSLVVTPPASQSASSSAAWLPGPADVASGPAPDTATPAGGAYSRFLADPEAEATSPDESPLMAAYAEWRSLREQADRAELRARQSLQQLALACESSGVCDVLHIEEQRQVLIGRTVFVASYRRDRWFLSEVEEESQPLDLTPPAEEATS